MTYLYENTNQNVIAWRASFGRYLITALFIAVTLLTVACSGTEDAKPELNIDPALGQAVFILPDDAANALFLSLANDDTEMLAELFGANYREVLPLDEVDGEDIDNFIRAWETSHTLLPEGEQKRMLAVGKNNWTLPIPITQGASGWYFNIDEGLERMRIRRIGRNELATMQAILAYHDAQLEYAKQDRNDDGMLEYARRFISTPGTHDGLYWDTADGEPASPLGPLMADHTPGGGYHGYYFRILEAQGEHARGGAYSYLLGDHMRAGFAAIAWPAEYGHSGIMSFIVSHAGIVYEQNLGQETSSVVEGIHVFDPDPDWMPAQEVNGPEPGSTQ